VTVFLRRWAPALLWTTLLFAVSSRPALPVDLHSGSDKVAHFSAYAVLGVALAYGQVSSGISVAWPLLIGVATGGLDELYQSTVPNRSADPLDWLADSLGVFFGVLCFHLWRRRRERTTPPAPRSEPLFHDR
jgi:VanZ family protein